MYRWLKPFMSAVENVSEWSGRIVGFIVVALALLTTFEVILRYAFNRPTVWGMELVTYLSGALYILGGAYVLKYRGHVLIDVIYRHFSSRTKAIIELFSFPLLFTFFGVLLWGGTKWSWFVLTQGRTSGSVWDPPIFPIVVTIPLAALLFLLQGLVKLIRDFRAAITGEEK